MATIPVWKACFWTRTPESDENFDPLPENKNGQKSSEQTWTTYWPWNVDHLLTLKRGPNVDHLLTLEHLSLPLGSSPCLGLDQTLYWVRRMASEIWHERAIISTEFQTKLAFMCPGVFGQAFSFCATSFTSVLSVFSNWVLRGFARTDLLGHPGCSLGVFPQPMQRRVWPYHWHSN